jgi:transcription termination factor Rho
MPDEEVFAAPDENTEVNVSEVKTENNEPAEAVEAQYETEVKQNENVPVKREEKRIEYSYELDGVVAVEGVVELMQEGYAFLRSSDFNYLSSPDDVYVSQSQIKSIGLKTGDTVKGYIRPTRENEKYYPMIRIEYVNGLPPEKSEIGCPSTFSHHSFQ